MGNNSRKKHSSEFKAKVALEALKEQMTLPELEKKFGVSQYMISRWKNELIENPTSVVNDLRNEIRGFIEYYNHQRHHQGIDGKVPWDLFLASA